MTRPAAEPGAPGECLARRLAGILPADRRRRDVPLAPLTTFRIGGPADWLVDVQDVDELVAVVRATHECRSALTVLGGGSNVLVADAGVRGLVARVGLKQIAAAGPGRVRAGAGATINGLVRWTTAHGLAGLERWAGTPGTVGGAVFGNAHFGGQNIGDLVEAALLVTPDGSLQSVEGRDMAFAYDESRLQRSGEVLLSAEFRVGAGEAAALRQQARESLAYRKRTQPLALPSGGCVFQNPDPVRDRLPDGIPASAGALVDRAGLKNARVGDAAISATHANFIVNHGAATAEDVRTLIEQARKAVRERFGVDLRDEIVRLGEF